MEKAGHVLETTHGDGPQIPREAGRIPKNSSRMFDIKRLSSASHGYLTLGQTGDPMQTEYIVVTNGGDLSLIRRHRKNIEEPLGYEWVRGRLLSAGVSIEVQEDEIQKEMKHHFSWGSPLSDEKIGLFIKLYQEVAKNLDPAEIEICGHSYANSTVDYGRLELSQKQELIEKCKPLFSAAEIEELDTFIEAHRDEDGVMTFRVTNLYFIEESR
jgi:hypothetical protein